MGFLAFIICIGLLIASIFRNKESKINPFTLFYALWSFILFLSVLNLYGMDKPSNEAYWLIILMLVFFYAGDAVDYYVERIKIKNKEKAAEENKEIPVKKAEEKREAKPKIKLIYFIFVLFIIFTMIDCVIIIINLAKGTSMSVMRRWRMGTYGVDKNPILSRRSFVEETFRSVILNPFETLIPPIATYYFFKEKAGKEKYLILGGSVLALVLSSFAGGGGRLGYLYYCMSIILGFVTFFKKGTLTEEEKKKYEKYKKYICIFLVVAFVIVLSYTLIRNGSGSFIKQTYKYFALPPTLLSNWLSEIKNASHTYGLLTTFGIHSYFFRAFDAIGLDILVPPIYDYTFQQLLNAEKFINVGMGTANAFVTPIYYFYIDGGYPFVCIASLLFGYLVIKASRKLMENMNIRNFTFYVLIMYGVFLTFIRIQTAIPSYIISFILAYILLGKVKVPVKLEGKINVLNSKANTLLSKAKIPIERMKEKWKKN